MPFTSGFDSAGNAFLNIGGASVQSELMQILEQDAIDPGSKPGYQACKTIYSTHPLGARMVDKPIQLAMSQEREIEVPGGPTEILVKAFRKEWNRIGAIGADNIIFRAVQLSLIYGVSTLFVNALKKDGKPEPSEQPFDFDKLWEQDLYFNIYDPLNTAGSLVLNQDPFAVDFMHPKQVSVGSMVLSNTKSIVLMHEQPIWIEWSDSAFGFVGRSVYQRPFYPLKSFIVSMIADQMIQDKLGLLVWKAKSPGAVVDMVARAFKAMQRSAIRGARTNNVLTIGESEDLASLDLEHVATAGEYSRRNIIKNIATGSGMPAQLLSQESLAEGFGEGSEDAKQIAVFIDEMRREMNPIYAFMDKLVQYRAWNPVFYEDIQRRYPQDYGSLSYKAAFHKWSDSFVAKWPNLLTEPDSEKSKASQAKVDSATKLAQAILAANPGAKTKAAVCEWLASVVSEEDDFYSTPLLIEAEDVEEAAEEAEAMMGETDPDEEEPENEGAGGNKMAVGNVKQNARRLRVA